MIVVNLFVLVAVLISKCDCFFNNIWETINPNLGDDGYLDTPTFARRYGYRCEEHFVTTSDGYIVKMHRLNGKIDGPVVEKSAPTIFLLHGILAADTNFILDGPNSIGGLLSDYGFDVWMGNQRGNRYSKNHTTLDTNSKEFWNFNFNEMSLIDCSTFIDYILRNVNKTSLHVIGNSQGGFMLSMLMAYKPSYNAKVKSLTFLASALYPGKLRSTILASLAKFLNKYSRNKIVYSNPVELLSYSPNNVPVVYKLCNKNSLFFGVCRALVGEIFGNEPKVVSNPDRFAYYVAHGGNGVSSNNLLHMAQCFSANRFGLYDYGPQKNIRKYGKSSPPRANFTLVTTPKLFIYGSADSLIPEEFVLASQPLTTNVKKIVRVDSYTHLNSLYAISIKEEITDVIRDFVISFE